MSRSRRAKKEPPKETVEAITSSEPSLLVLVLDVCTQKVELIILSPFPPLLQRLWNKFWA